MQINDPICLFLFRSGTTETPDEDTSSRRSRRRRGTEDEIDTGASEVSC